MPFDSGDKLMGFFLRGSGDYTSAIWITADGQATALDDGAFTATPLEWHDVAGRQVPTTWQVNLPAQDVDVTVAGLNPDAWMQTSAPYWEGPVTTTGSHNGKGYLEMTGYD